MKKLMVGVLAAVAAAVTAFAADVVYLSTNGGTSFDAYPSLQDAATACTVANKSIVELRGDLELDAAVSFPNVSGIIFRSSPGNRFKVTRTSAEACLTFNGASAQVKDIEFDGGARWQKADDLLDLGNDGVGAGVLLDAPRSGFTLSGVLIHHAQAPVGKKADDRAGVIYRGRNVGMMTLDGGTKITDCRGPVIVDQWNNQITFGACEISNCGNPETGTQRGIVAQRFEGLGWYAFGDGFVMTGNCVAAGCAFHAITSTAELRFNGGKVVIADNYRVTAGDEGTVRTPADLILYSNVLKFNGLFAADTHIGITYDKPPSAVEGLTLGTVIGFEVPQNAFECLAYDPDPTLVGGLQNGTTVVWKQKGTDDPTYGDNDAEVFRLTNPGEGPKLFRNLRDAFDAAAQNAVIDILADAVCGDYTVVRTTVTLQSDPAAGARYTLTRTTPAPFYLTGSSAIAPTLTVRNLVIDGSGDAVGAGDVFQVKYDGGKGATLALQDGTRVQNAVVQNAVVYMHDTSNSGGAFTTEGDVTFTGCTGPVFTRAGHGGACTLRGCTITDCTTSSFLICCGGNSNNINVYDLVIENNTITGTGCALYQDNKNFTAKIDFKGGHVVIRDNKRTDGSQANVSVSKAAALKLSGDLDETSYVGVRFPTTEADFEASKVFGANAYVGTADYPAHVFHWDLAPETYYGALNGADLKWVEVGSDVKEEQAAVFAVSTDGGETFPQQFNKLALAVAAAAGGGIIELTDDAWFDSTVSIPGSLTIRSRAPDRFTLSRKTPCSLSPVAVAGLSVTITNLTLDGGAGWANAFAPTLTEAEFLANPDGVGELAMITFDSSSHPSRTLRLADVDIRNVKGTVVQQNTWNESVYLNGVTVRDCRSSGAILRMNQSSTLRVDGLTVTNCYAGQQSSSADGGILWHNSNTGSIYLKNVEITGNVCKNTAVYYRMSGAGTSFNFEAGKTVIRDNTQLGAPAKQANFFRADDCVTLPKLVGELEEGSYVSVASPTSGAVDGYQFMALDTSAKASVGCFHYDGNPVDGVNYVGAAEGSFIAWVDEESVKPLVQDEVFRLTNPGEEPVVFSLLEKALEQARDGATIELTADALFDQQIEVPAGAITLTSAAGGPYVLKRVKSAALTLHGSAAPVADAQLTVSNVVIDGGAVWTNPSDPADISNDGVKPGAVFSVGCNGRAAKGRLVLAAGATIRNVQPKNGVIYMEDDSNVGGVLTMEAGAVIEDCRGGYPVINTQSHGGEIYLNGGTIRNCCGCGASGDGSNGIVRRGGNSNDLRLGGVVITNNVVSEAQAVCCAADGTAVLRFTGGAPVIRDNVRRTVSVTIAANVQPSRVFKISGSLLPGADVRINFNEGVGNQIATLTAAGVTGEEYLRFEGDPLVRAKATEPGVKNSTVVWANRLLLGETVELAEAFDATGVEVELCAGGVAPERTTIYTLIRCPAGITGAFEFTKPTEKGAPLRYWGIRLANGRTELAADYFPPGLMLLVK